MRVGRALLFASAFCLLGCPGEKQLPPGAVLLFDVDFASPGDTAGAVPKVYEEGAEQTFPSNIPSQLFLGPPKVVDKLCGLEQQPASFSSADGELGHVGLEFLLDQRYGHYHVELDVCVANLGVPPLQSNEPQFAIFLDIPDAYALGFFEQGRLVVIDPARGTDAVTAPQVIGAWTVGKPLHVDLDFDLTTQVWSISVDGAKLFDGKFEVSIPRAVRVVMRGNKANVAAVDNVMIWAENDLSKGLEELPAPKTGTNE